MNLRPKTAIPGLALGVCMLLLPGACLGDDDGGGGSPSPPPAPPEKSLSDRIRPLQMGTKISLGSGDGSGPSKLCSFGFYAEPEYGVSGVTSLSGGLVTAAHCTNMKLDDWDDYEVAYGEPVWQSSPSNSVQVAQVMIKPQIRWPGEGSGDRYCPYTDPKGNTVDYCLLADAAYAEFDIADPPGNRKVGAVSSVDLSVFDTVTKPVMEDDPDRQTAVLQTPIEGEYIYKIGYAGGKTEGYVERWLKQSPTVAALDGKRVLLLGVYAVQNVNSPPLVIPGDSGGPVMHSRNPGNPYGPFWLAGITVQSLGPDLAIVEPIGDIQAELSIIPLFDADDGYLSITATKR